MQDCVSAMTEVSSTATGDFANCVYCRRATSGCRDEHCLKCTDCDTVVHFSCLTTWVRVAENCLLGDVFYKFTCKSCSPTRLEVVVKEKVSWLTVLVLTLYNLKELPHLSRYGFFHWKVHIADFIDRKWNYIFGSSVRRKRAWHGTVSGTLSHYSPSFFQTGTHMLKESGWWKLSHDNLSPFNIVRLKYDTSGVTERQSIARNIYEEGFTEDENLLRQNPSPSNATCSTGTADSVSTDLDADMLSFSDSENLDVDIDMPMDIIKEEGFPQMESELSDLVDQYVSSEGVHSMSPRTISTMAALDQSSEMYDSERDSDSSSDSDEGMVSTPPPKSLFKCREERPLPWQQNCVSSVNRSEGCVPMTEYEEVQLLQMLSKYLEKSSGSEPSQVLRFYRKLIVRREQRHQRLGHFSDVLLSICDVNSSPGKNYASGSARTLDRYQVHSLNGNQHSPINQQSFRLRLLGKVDPTCFVSPYTERLLKPFIRRDFHCEPLRVQLMADILRRAPQCSGFTQPTRYPIDYSYVQPHHIPAVNSLCELFFWPGIDLTESLLYPDFSCVALYRKIVVGFAFMVPDVSYNESYISFLFTHPEWRRAGIATFMLYHLIQTCMGKDITLHVSVTNPAVMLYQKFGFKVEELVQDFYDKYLPADSKDCKHALFLRLNR